jgi:hypothetical protein
MVCAEKIDSIPLKGSIMKTAVILVLRMTIKPLLSDASTEGAAQLKPSLTPAIRSLNPKSESTPSIASVSCTK